MFTRWFSTILVEWILLCVHADSPHFRALRSMGFCLRRGVDDGCWAHQVALRCERLFFAPLWPSRQVRAFPDAHWHYHFCEVSTEYSRVAVIALLVRSFSPQLSVSCPSWVGVSWRNAHFYSDICFSMPDAFAFVLWSRASRMVI